MSTKSSAVSGLFGSKSNGGGKAPSIDEQRRHYKESLIRAPPTPNATRPGRGAANACSGTVILVIPKRDGSKSFSKASVVVVVQTDQPMLVPIRPPKFKWINADSKTPEMLAKEQQIRDNTEKEIYIHSGTKLRISYKSGADAGELSFGDQIKVAGLEASPEWNEIEKKPGELESGMTWYNANSVILDKKLEILELAAIMEKLSREQGIPLAFTQPIHDRDLLDLLSKEADRITTITRIGGPDTYLEEDHGYHIVPSSVSADKLSSQPKFGGTEGKVPTMVSTFMGALSNGSDLLGFSFSTTWYESMILSTWDISSAEQWIAMFEVLLSERVRTYVIGTFNTASTSNSHLMCRPPKLFSETVSTSVVTDDATGEEKTEVSYKTFEPAFGFAVDTSVVMVDFRSLVEIGYPILNSKLIKTLLPPKAGTPRPSATQSRGFVLANAATQEVIDNLVSSGWVGVYITKHPQLKNNKGDPIPEFQLPADIFFAPDYPKDDKMKRDRITKALAFQQKSKDRDPNPFVTGLQQVLSKDGAPDINKSDFLIYLMEPKTYKAAVDMLMSPHSYNDTTTPIDTGILGLIVKQSQMSLEAAEKIIADNKKSLEATADAVGGLTLEELGLADVPDLAPKEAESKMHVEEASLHQPEAESDLFNENANSNSEKKRERDSSEEEEKDDDVNPPPAKRSKATEKPSKSAASSKKKPSK